MRTERIARGRQEVCPGRASSLIHSAGPSRTAATAPHHDETEQKTKVVPASVVVSLIDVYAFSKERNEEGDGQNHAVPKTEPEACDRPVRSGLLHSHKTNNNQSGLERLQKVFASALFFHSSPRECELHPPDNSALSRKRKHSSFRGDSQLRKSVQK